MSGKFAEGDLVRLTREACKSMGIVAGRAAADGVVIGVAPGLKFPVVAWSDSNRVSPVNPANLEHKKSPGWTPGVRSAAVKEGKERWHAQEAAAWAEEQATWQRMGKPVPDHVLKHYRAVGVVSNPRTRNPRERVGERTPKQASMKAIASGTYDKVRHWLDGVESKGFADRMGEFTGRATRAGSTQQMIDIARSHGAKPREIERAYAQGQARADAQQAKRARHNPVDAGDDVTKPYPFQRKEENYAGRWPPKELAQVIKAAVQERDAADRYARPLGDRAAEARAAAEKAIKARDSAQRRYQEAYDTAGWYADDVHTLANERSRMEGQLKMRASSLQEDLRSLRMNPQLAPGVHVPSMRDMSAVYRHSDAVVERAARPVLAAIKREGAHPQAGTDPAGYPKRGSSVYAAILAPGGHPRFGVRQLAAAYTVARRQGANYVLTDCLERGVGQKPAENYRANSGRAPRPSAKRKH